MTPHIFATLKNAVSKYALYYPTHGVNQYLVDVKFYFTNILKIDQSKNPPLPQEIPTSSPGLCPQKKWVEREIGTGLASHAENSTVKTRFFQVWENSFLYLGVLIDLLANFRLGRFLIRFLIRSLKPIIYSRLPITRTFKRNRKKFDLSGARIKTAGRKEKKLFLMHSEYFNHI